MTINIGTDAVVRMDDSTVQQRIEQLVTTKMYINGTWVDAMDGSVRAVIDPATEKQLTDVAEGDVKDARAAIAAARRAFDDGPWPQTSARDRARWLFHIADLVEQDKPNLARLETLDTGKTIAESEADMDDIAACFRYFASLVATETGTVNDVPTEALSLTLREPVGVCSLITPWNYPLLQASWKIAPAIGAGNTCVIKPSELTPLTTLRLARLIDKTDLPPGVFNVVLGPGATVGETMTTDPAVDLISFTGGATTARHIMKNAADTFKRVALELGGKNANIILDDADLDVALDHALNAAYFHAGQVCSAGSRLLVSEAIYDEFVSRLVERVRRIRVGTGFQPETEMGPVISAEHRDKVEAYIALGREEGARLACGGGRPEGESFRNGYWLQPTVLVDVDESMRIAREEIFGPVITVERFRTDEEAIRLANGTDYGLAGAVWSTNIGRAHRIGRRLRLGTVWINDFHPYYPEAPWGGYKGSGIGRELGKAGLDEYIELKHLYVNLDPRADGWFKG